VHSHIASQNGTAELRDSESSALSTYGQQVNRAYIDASQCSKTSKNVVNRAIFPLLSVTGNMGKSQSRCLLRKTTQQSLRKH
jgi:hypothetical protein